MYCTRNSSVDKTAERYAEIPIITLTTRHGCEALPPITLVCFALLNFTLSYTRFHFHRNVHLSHRRIATFFYRIVTF